VFTQQRSLMETCEEIRMIKDFADHVSADVAAEFDSIDARCQDGQIATVLDLEAAQNYPIARLEIGARAIAYEITALVEQQLHAAAEEPWMKDERYKGPKRPRDLPAASLGQLRTVTDLNYDKVLALVEQHYGISLADFPGWTALAELRNRVNSFKHRGGWKRPRDVDWVHAKLSVDDLRNQIGFDQALGAIDALYAFVRAFSRATKHDSSPRSSADSGPA
jgi:hypothetical protein